MKIEPAALDPRAEVLDEPPPEPLAYLYQTFLELHPTRIVGLAPSAISFSEIVSYSSLYGMRFEPWEIETIRAIDGVWLKVVNDQRASSKSDAPKEQ